MTSKGIEQIYYEKKKIYFCNKQEKETLRQIKIYVKENYVINSRYEKLQQAIETLRQENILLRKKLRAEVDRAALLGLRPCITREEK